ncbi:MORN motif protein (macronuclear) [Tetrahymena thermophila SB210]|uniref:MORN motif protein n=1 Tax=Tetrahymena thermophila (strain SB210) TaxID=312017 RepID=Q24GL8_TETTS|nr:MORN motif protein [Tetrahymena thermophila SB210]EAS06853.1 MORN motif protein [Tetrahymena thermophila SB210]|eukprot:XP_001027095.1 MORN motif protein [Tetrahymena thermophila SB210]
MADQYNLSAQESQKQLNGDDIASTQSQVVNDSHQKQVESPVKSPKLEAQQIEQSKTPKSDSHSKKRPPSGQKRISIHKKIDDSSSKIQQSPQQNTAMQQELENGSQLNSISSSNQIAGSPNTSKSPLKKRSESIQRQRNGSEIKNESMKDSQISKKDSSQIRHIQDNLEMINNLNEKLRKLGEMDGDQTNPQSSYQDYLQMRINKAEKIRQDLTQPMDPQQLLEYFQNHKVHSTEILNMEELNKSQYLRLKRYKQCIYYGEVQNSSRTGKGLMMYFSGRLYEGDWQNDAKFGRGFELYPNGNAYEGYFVNGKPEGFGTYIWYNGEIYDGEWVNGMKHGSGQWMGVRGDSYTGEWKFGKADGKGVHKWINGDVYEGDFKCCLKHGKGQERFSNGDIYIGQYANGRPEGYGEYFWKDGAHYKGYFKNGLRHGQGIWRKKKDAKITDTYEGEYINDKRCGYGVFTWASGNIYKGEYFEDLRHGYGEMYWTDTSYYKGEWERGIQCGEGELYIPGEGIKKGTFVNNIFKQNGPGSNGQSQYRSFKSISEENSTPRGIYQGSMTKRQFNPHTPVLTEESKTVPTSNPHGSGSNIGYHSQQTPPSVSDFSTKLPHIKSHNNSFDIQSMRSYPGKKDQGHQADLNYQTAYDLGYDETDQQQSSNGLSSQKRSISVQQKRDTESRSTQTHPNSQNTISSERVRLRRGKSGSNATLLPPLNESVSPNIKRSNKKNREILLKKHELILWKGMRPKLNLKPRELRDYSDQKTVEIIRSYLHPPVWKPSGVAHCLDSSSPNRSPSPNGSVHQQSIQKRYSRIL